MIFNLKIVAVLTVLLGVSKYALADFSAMTALDTSLLYACPSKPALTSIMYGDDSTTTRFGKM